MEAERIDENMYRIELDDRQERILQGASAVVEQEPEELLVLWLENALAMVSITIK